MKQQISALMDGEAERHEMTAPLEALGSEGEARDTWRRYHLIGDAMRDTKMLSAGFSSRVAAKLAAEPTVMAPVRMARTQVRQRWQVLSAAASLAAVALVGWVAFAPQESALTTAQSPAPAAQGTTVAVQGTPAAVQVAPPSSANDYLYAHQALSPRNTLQGVAPYVRMVSGETAVPKR